MEKSAAHDAMHFLKHITTLGRANQMNVKAVYPLCVVLFGVFIVSGCHRTPEDANQLTAQKDKVARQEYDRRGRNAEQKLTTQIADADRLVVSDWAHGAIMSITGREAKDLVRAISSAKWGMGVKFGAQSEIEFYRKTNLLLTIAFGDSLFITSPRDGEFVEMSGLLAALQRKLESDPVSHRAWVDHLAEQVTQRADAAKLQEWCVALMGRREQEAGNSLINRSEIPGWFETGSEYWLSLLVADITVQRSDTNQANCILMEWYYQYGLLVGPTTGYETTLNVSYITNVAPGICVFHR